MHTPSEVTIVEVGPRDGLQNESVHTSVEFRIELIERLSQCGLSTIEVGSFVSPKWVPQMADTDQVLKHVKRNENVQFIVLVPNEIGMNAAARSNVDRIAVFTAASETFCKKNTNCTIDESFERFKPVFEIAAKNDVPVRGYISCVLGCPYEGAVSVKQVVSVATKLIDMGCYEVSLGDTIGIGTVNGTGNLLQAVSNEVDVNSLAVHFHDTYGQALPNIITALDHGISIVDSSVGGLGGCPYAKGASGNVATEDVVYMLDGMGVRTNVDMNKLTETSGFVFNTLGRAPTSRVSAAHLGKTR